MLSSCFNRVNPAKRLTTSYKQYCALFQTTIGIYEKILNGNSIVVWNSIDHFPKKKQLTLKQMLSAGLSSFKCIVNINMTSKTSNEHHLDVTRYQCQYLIRSLCNLRHLYPKESNILSKKIFLKDIKMFENDKRDLLFLLRRPVSKNRKQFFRIWRWKSQDNCSLSWNIIKLLCVTGHQRWTE